MTQGWSSKLHIGLRPHPDGLLKPFFSRTDVTDVGQNDETVKQPAAPLIPPSVVGSGTELRSVLRMLMMRLKTRMRSYLQWKMNLDQFKNVQGKLPTDIQPEQEKFPIATEHMYNTKKQNGEWQIRHNVISCI